MEPVCPSVGWGVLHLFATVGPEAEAETIVAAVKAAENHDHQVVAFAVLGHKADLGLMALGPDLWRLRRLQADLTAAGVRLTASYVSLTEVSEYAAGLPAERLDARLHPRLPPPGKRALCFYPMSKRREEPGRNWYTLPYEERLRLMLGHGRVGREFAGRVLQLITGSVGLDDWEWAVTLFAEDPVALKECVYRMRFDEASALFAEFGPFVTGLVAPIDEVLAACGLG
ncbi:MAG: chlorite dismutase family protein [Actinobacteria bacterium]|nr:chlorite dismutase family protein [Actinomycetota bacterium]